MNFSIEYALKFGTFGFWFVSVKSDVTDFFFLNSHGSENVCSCGIKYMNLYNIKIVCDTRFVLLQGLTTLGQCWRLDLSEGPN